MRLPFEAIDKGHDENRGDNRHGEDEFQPLSARHSFCLAHRSAKSDHFDPAQEHHENEDNGSDYDRRKHEYAREERVHLTHVSLRQRRPPRERVECMNCLYGRAGGQESREGSKLT